MIRRPTTRRTGTSLLEVLVGIGIMAIGAISAFVLFPFAAINVSRGLVDDRTTTCAITADGQIREIHRNRVVAPESIGGKAGEQYQSKMDDPQTGNPAVGQPHPTPVPKDSSQPSYPVLVDPMGVAAGGSTTYATNVGKGGSVPTTGPPFLNPTLIPRVSLTVVTTAADPNKMALRFCSQLDGLLFDEGGAVSTTNPDDMRELRYNWFWVLQRPVNRDRHTVRQQVVVCNRRAHLFVPPNCEAVHTARFVVGENTITGVSTSAEVSKGTWVMDGTLGNDDGGRAIGL
jgi:hypothetical protein